MYKISSPFGAVVRLRVETHKVPGRSKLWVKENCVYNQVVAFCFHNGQIINTKV